MTGGIGTSLPRLEDARLITGRGRYSDDFTLPGQVCATVVRSPHAHTRILSIDASAARALPGVLAVLTGTDMPADGLRPVGDAVAVVVVKTRAIALDATKTLHVEGGRAADGEDGSRARPAMGLDSRPGGQDHVGHQRLVRRRLVA